MIFLNEYTMNQSRINDGCKDGRHDHDNDIKTRGYCEQCGKRMTIKRLMKLYNETKWKL